MKKLVLLAAVAAVAAITATTALAAPAGVAEARAEAKAAAAEASSPGRPAAASPSLVEVALAVNAPGSPFAGSFDVLLCLVTKYPGIVSTLSEKGQYTVFAPTDTAFSGIGLTEANCEAFQAANPAAVEDILLYHVAKGRRDAADVISSSQIRMLNGDFAAVTSMNGAYYIDGAQIIVTDVPASNGIIHAVGSVLLP